MKKKMKKLCCSFRTIVLFDQKNNQCFAVFIWFTDWFAIELSDWSMVGGILSFILSKRFASSKLVIFDTPPIPCNAKKHNKSSRKLLRKTETETEKLFMQTTTKFQQWPMISIFAYYSPLYLQKIYLRVLQKQW